MTSVYQLMIYLSLAVMNLFSRDGSSDNNRTSTELVSTIFNTEYFSRDYREEF